MAASPVTNVTSVFCPPLPGKPGPYAADGTRVRVPQSGQKEDTCVYYALQILRDEHRIGKNPPANLASKRDIEAGISDHRKACSKVDSLFRPQVAFAKYLTENLGEPYTKKIAFPFDSKQISPKHKKALLSASLSSFCAQNMHANAQDPCLEEEMKRHETLLSASQRSFCAQNMHDNFSDFVQESYLEEEMKRHESFLNRNGGTAEYIKNAALQFFGKPWAQLSLWHKVLLERNLVFELSYSAYGCKRSAWHPEQGIEELITQLQLHGPHLVMGKIGQTYYDDDPSLQSKKIEGRSIFYWKPNASRDQSTSRANHAVVLVGASIDKQNRKVVYFLDPRDGSKDLATQKIYMISYERLKTLIASLDGRIMKSREDGKPVFLKPQEDGPYKGENNYALYMPKSTQV